MTKDFEVIGLADNLEYNYLVVLCKSESPYEFLDGIAHSLNSQIGDCKILIDEILHVGNTEKRYMEFSLIDGKLVDGKFVRIPKSSDFRALSCAFLKNNDVMEGSIISSVQYRMINKGIVIYENEVYEPMKSQELFLGFFNNK